MKELHTEKVLVLPAAAAAAAKSLQSCPTVWPHRRQPTSLPVPGILQARTLEWVAISFSNAWKWKGKVKSLSHVGLLATPWAAAHQAPPSMGFSRREHWSGVPSPSPLVLPRDMKNIQTNRKAYHSRTGELTLQSYHLHILIHRFTVVLIKISFFLSMRTNEVILKFI